jgi:thiamine biosynthesis lipoprotein
MEIKIKDKRLSENEMTRIIDRAFDLAERLEMKLSVYEEGSEINRLNMRKNLDTSEDLFNVLKAASRAGILTDGEFDITVSPVLKRDGFYKDIPDRILGNIPDSTQGIGWQNISFAGNRRIAISDNTWLDLSGIAKGYIVDRIARFIRAEGASIFLVNAGGDIFCGDKEERSAGWLVGIREPDGDSILKVLALRNMAIATSGDYENIHIDALKGEILSHIISPSEGEPLIEKPSSVTVLAPTCAEADALATGMMAMGEDKALALADRIRNINIITSRKISNKSIIRYSAGAEYFVLED